MTGRRHHYIPRFLQRPFAHRQSGKEFYVYAHHCAHGVYPTNVMNVGQERDFYGDSDDESLDEEITRGEAQLAATVNKLNMGEHVKPTDIASLIAAISFRTKATRKALTDLVEPMMEAGRSRMLEGREFQGRLHLSLNDPKERKKLIYKHIRKTSGHLGREQQARMYLLMLPTWKDFVKKNEEIFLAQAQAWAGVALDHLREKASEIGDSAFLKALASGPNMPERAKRLVSEMVFEVWDAPKGEHFILGDCCTVGLFTDGKARLALGSMDNDIEMEIAFLPISPTRCIVSRKPPSARPISVAELNQMSAGASYEFFISAHADAAHLKKLREAIGTIEPIANSEEIVRILTRG